MTSRFALQAALLLALAPMVSRADEGVHVAVAGGFGLAQGLAGVNVQVRKSHLALFAGTGAIYATLNGDSYDGPTYGAVVGARFYSGDSGDRFFVSAQFAFNTQESLGDPK